jgi:GLPGLI family protein
MTIFWRLRINQQKFRDKLYIHKNDNIMKNNKYLLAVIVLLISLSATSQNFQGKAHYVSKTSITMDFGNRNIPEAQKARINEMMNSVSSNNFVLEFNDNTASYAKEVKLEQNSQPSNGRRAMLTTLLNQNGGTYYKNIVDKTYKNQYDLYGKLFLVEDELQEIEWQMSDEVKTIGKYTCFKATATIKQFSLPKKLSLGQQPNEETFEDLTKDRQVTAWYTLDIPVGHGPDMYWGLPGLILEIKTENTILLCSKIELIRDELSINPPKKGKKVNQEAYDEIMEKKTKEVREQFRNRRRNGNRGRRN